MGLRILCSKDKEEKAEICKKSSNLCAGETAQKHTNTCTGETAAGEAPVEELK